MDRKKIKIKEELDTNKKFKKCWKRIHVLYIYVLRIIFWTKWGQHFVHYC